MRRDSEVRTFHPTVTRALKMLPDTLGSYLYNTLGSYLHMLPLSPNHEACRSPKTDPLSNIIGRAGANES